MEGFAHRKPGIKDGEDMERSFLGSGGSKFSKELLYVPYKEAITQVIQNQPAQLPQFTQNLIAQINVKFPALDGRIQFYTAVGTPLDVYHGVDAFFKLGEHIVTVDLTTNPEKTSAKADLVLHADFDEDGGIKFTESDMHNLAKDLSRVFAGKIQSKMH